MAELTLTDTEAQLVHDALLEHAVDCRDRASNLRRRGHPEAADQWQGYSETLLAIAHRLSDG